MAEYGGIWQTDTYHFSEYGGIWQNMAEYGRIWRNMAIKYNVHFLEWQII